LIGVSAARAVEAWKVRSAPPDDAALVEAVLARISGRPGLDVSAVTATASAGALQLSGKVASLFDRGEIEHLASGVRGVLTIDDRMEVMRLDGPDASLQVNADRALGGLPRLRGFRIQVSVTDALLDLDGEVPLARDRIDAEESVSHVPGIVAIRNRLHLTPYTIAPERLQSRLEALLHDRLVFGAVEDLKVAVGAEGQVTLDGVVTSQADRARAERLAYGVRGVVSIDNKLIVRLIASPSR
jgi:osmotically-inducible protein OsmY